MKSFIAKSIYMLSVVGIGYYFLALPARQMFLLDNWNHWYYPLIGIPLIGLIMIITVQIAENFDIFTRVD